MAREIQTALFMWDAPSENANGLKPDQRRWLRAVRKRLWRKVRYEYGCFPYNESAYIIMHEEQIPLLNTVAKEFREEYEKHGYTAKVDIVTFKRDAGDVKEWLELSFVQTLIRQTATFERAEIAKKTVSKVTIRKAEQDVEWIKAGCKKYGIKSDQIKTHTTIVNEKIRKHNKLLGKSEKATKWVVS